MKILLKNLLILLVFALGTQYSIAQIISGKVLYKDNKDAPISNVTVLLTNVDTHEVLTFVTGPDGAYYFDNLPDGTYVLSGKTSRESGSVGMDDAQMVLDYLNGELDLTPMQLLAADVNGSGNVTHGDYQLIRNYILKQHDFPAGEWQFESSVFSIPPSRIAEGIPTGIGGTCSGDVAGVFVPVGRSKEAIPVSPMGEQFLFAGKSFSTTLNTHADLCISSAGLIINFPSDLMSVKSVEFEGANFEYTISGNQIRLVWDDQNSAPLHFEAGSPLLTIQAVANNKPEVEKAALNLEGNSCLVDSRTRKSAIVQIETPMLKIGKPGIALANYPNPCKTATTLTIESPVEGSANIEIYDAIGHLVKTVAIPTLRAGMQEIKLNTQSLATGKYICKLKVQGESSNLSKTIQLMKVD